MKAANSEEVTAAMKSHVKLADALGLFATPSFVIKDVAINGYPGRKAMEGIIQSLRRCNKVGLLRSGRANGSMLRTCCADSCGEARDTADGSRRGRARSVRSGRSVRAVKLVRLAQPVILACGWRRAIIAVVAGAASTLALASGAVKS